MLFTGFYKETGGNSSTWHEPFVSGYLIPVALVKWEEWDAASDPEC